MADQKDSEQKKKLTLSGSRTVKKVVDAGSVRQSFSHGRSRTVAVEVKKRRFLGKLGADGVPGSKGKPSIYPNKPAGATDEEWEKRLRVLNQAQELRASEEEKAKEKSDAHAALAAEQRSASQEGKRRQEENIRLLTEREQKKKDALKAEKEARTPKKEEPAVAPTADAAVDPAAAIPGEKDDSGVGKRLKKFGFTGKEAAPSSDASKAKKKKLTLSKGSESKRRSGKFTVSQALGMGDGGEPGRQRSMAALKRAREKQRLQELGENSGERKKIIREVILPEAITVQELANRMAERSADVVKTLMQLGIMATLNQTIDADTAELVIGEFGHKIKRVSESDVEDVIRREADDPKTLKPRPPVITVMGHVDHGKTSLLDALRKADVAAHEAGGITQHIGAYQVTLASGQKITFLDTPGHAAFTQMRSRGANITDLVILVVAADDGIMEQTIEAINHARSAKVPMIVAINKMDRPNADPNKVRTALLQHEVIVESMSGDVLDVEISAKTGAGMDKLEEIITLQSEMLELKANPDRLAEGTIVESKVEKGRGSVATVLIQRGTLKVGDIFVAGAHSGKVRALIDDKGKTITQAGPSVPVEVLGLSGTPEAGDDFSIVESETQAREIAEFRQEALRKSLLAKSGPQSLEQFFSTQNEGDKKALGIVIKTDVQGSLEALTGSFEKIGNDEVEVRILHSGVGEINESDIALADAAQGLVLGFNVRANPQARNSAKQSGVHIRYYSVIYNMLDDVKAALSGLLSPDLKEKFLGYAKVREIFNITKVGRIAGCMITEGVVKRGSGVRLLRDNVVIHEGKLKTLKRFKEEVKEVRESFECGMAFENYQDVRVDDQIECFEVEEVARTLD
ncbi:MAG: translation initiation factor IF-2 [bacterium]|nr:translation initiation factor IF-2 [bacterium]